MCKLDCNSESSVNHLQIMIYDLICTLQIMVCRCISEKINCNSEFRPLFGIVSPVRQHLDSSHYALGPLGTWQIPDGLCLHCYRVEAARSAARRPYYMYPACIRAAMCLT